MTENAWTIYELRPKLLVWGKCHHQMWGVPYRLSGFWMFRASTSKQKHAIYSVGWFDLLHDRELPESKPRCASSFWQQMQITIKYSNTPSFILVTLTIGTYETVKRRIALSLAHNKDSKPWTLSCGQSLFFPSLLCKEFVQHEGMVVTRFHHSWSWSIKLVQFHTGMVWPGIKMIQTEYRLVSVGVSVGPAYILQKHAKARFKHAWAVWKAPQKAH